MNAPSKKPVKPAKKPAAATAENSKNPATGPNVLQVVGDPKDMENIYAELAVQGMVSNMMLMQTFGKRSNGEIGITPAVKALRETMKEVHAGNMQSSETLLYSQAVALNAMFSELSLRSALNMGTFPQAAESYMRLALKAQSQSRNTLETLANIKNPPVVFARQANIANGPQQVNNGVSSPSSPACGQIDNQQTKLLGETLHGGTNLDAGAKGAAARGHQTLEAVGAVHRAKER